MADAEERGQAEAQGDGGYVSREGFGEGLGRKVKSSCREEDGEINSGISTGILTEWRTRSGSRVAVYAE